jgi:hypothetical protein
MRSALLALDCSVAGLPVLSLGFACQLKDELVISKTKWSTSKSLVNSDVLHFRHAPFDEEERESF